MKIWYTIEKSTNGYTIWENKEKLYNNHGRCGCKKIYTSINRKECIEYCKNNNIKVKK